VPREFRADIQALRGIAVLLVVLYHADLGLFRAGYLGVDVFFVISGFLITGLLKTQLEQGRFSFSEFYYRRAKRLLPAAYIVIGATVLAAPLFLSDLGLQEFRHQVLGALTFTGNIVLWLQSDYFAEAAGAKPLLHLWSLAIEEQYYLLIPAFLLLAPKRFWLAGIGGLLLISLIACFTLSAHNPSAAFYLLPTRLWEMAIGSFGTLLPPYLSSSPALSRLRLPAFFALLVIPAYPFGGFHPGTNAALVCVATLIILLTRTRDNAVLGSLARVGDLSYSLYLIHWPVLVYLRAAWFPEPPPYAIYGALAVSWIASWMLHRFVEEPFRRGSFSHGRLASGLVAASILLALAPSTLKATSPSRTDFKKIRQANFGLGFTCAFKPGVLPTEVPKECQTDGHSKLLLWGDSYAMAIAAGLAKTMGGMGLAQLTMSSCGPAIGMAVFFDSPGSRYPRTFAEDCIQFNDRVLALLKTHPEIEVVAITGQFIAPLAPSGKLLVRRDQTYSDERTGAALFVSGMKALVDEVRALGKRVVVIAPPPSSGVNVGDCLERKAKGYLLVGRYGTCEIPIADHLAYQADVLRMLEQLRSEAKIEIVSLDPFLCNDRGCKTQIDGKFIYRDDGHLSYDGSEVVARQYRLAEKLLAAAR